jgi:GDP-4-dehydro-6-deoxy-D-mannose reductase
MARVLITGAAGFIGVHLVQYLRSVGDEVFAFDRVATLSPALSREVRLFGGSIHNRAALRQALSEAKPNVIYHLAGLIKSTEPLHFYTTHVLGTASLFEVVVAAELSPKVLIASSSAVYGVGSAKPITERVKPRPMTHYAVSKLAQEAVAQRFQRAHRLLINIARAFNLAGPGQPPTLACSAFAQEISQSERTRETGVLVTGNLSSQRDFIDVRDVARAYHAIAKAGQAGTTYNICSERAVSIQHCVNTLLQLARTPIRVERDPNRLQADDVPIQVGSAACLRSHTGWRPEIPLEQSLADLLDYWRHAL